MMLSRQLDVEAALRGGRLMYRLRVEVAFKAVNHEVP